MPRKKSKAPAPPPLADLSQSQSLAADGTDSSISGGFGSIGNGSGTGGIGGEGLLDADSSTNPPTPLPYTPVPARRKRGRPSRASLEERNKNFTPRAGEGAVEYGVSEIGTPNNPINIPGLITNSARGGSARRGGRPNGSSGKNARSRGGPSHQTQVPLDKEGNEQTVADDEIVLEEDPLGQEKVDHNGNLLGGREYRCRTFTILNRGDRLYMLSTEPARCVGFRDSYLFFHKHRQLCKIITLPEEKYDLIARKIIPHSYKGRAIGVVTARSVFREFGSRIVIGGRRVIDDFWETQSIRDGAVYGELADPADKLPGPGEEYNRNQYVAWYGASRVYHTGQLNEPSQQTHQQHKRKKVPALTDETWMSAHASAASEFNTRLLKHREPCGQGVYEPHTNQTHIPRSFQPQFIRLSTVGPYNNQYEGGGDGEGDGDDGDDGGDFSGTLNTSMSTRANDNCSESSKFIRVLGRDVVYEEVMEPRPFVGNGLGAFISELGNRFGEWSDSIIDALETEEEKAAVRAQVVLEREWARRWS